MRQSPEETLAAARTTVPDGAYLTAAVVILTHVIPGEEDDDERGPFLAWRCDGEAGRWTHLGMVETAAGDMRAGLRLEDGDE